MRFRRLSLAFLLMTLSSTASVLGVEVTMYKHPQCGCCEKWADHLRENGFTVESRSFTAMQQVKDQLGIPDNLRSCHTAVVEGRFLVEGHVPASSLRRFLQDPTAGVAGLSVPDMPFGSPGMEHPTRSDSYEVYLFDRQGTPQVFEQID